ncbi:hypothetical protein ACH4E7_25715 [Kitasatospora sp. NPDC018058]|uniref:hypothetical protein n=1 Tax=Kitasatospora sp. NPDC018058 TaxID=3364025 RepID=UPI0037BF9FFD
MPSMNELADDRPATWQSPQPATNLPEVPDRPMPTFPLDSTTLHGAATELLDQAWELRFDDEDRTSKALAGGGHVMCQMFQLPEELAPLIEAEAVLLALNAAGLHPVSLSDPRLPAMVAAFDTKPVHEQRALLRMAARPWLDASTTAGRAHAATTRTIPPTPQHPSGPTDRPPPLSLPNRNPALGR